MSELYRKDTYLNKNIEILLNKIIIEYDLKSANTSLCREYSLIPEKDIEKIEKLNKEKRNKQIGLLQRKDKLFKDYLKSAFVDIRKRFILDNDLDDNDILSIKKDAIFCLKEVNKTEFGNCIFDLKHKYTSYLYLDKLEFYYNSKNKVFGDNGRLDIKGIGDNELKKHKDYMIDFFMKLFRHLETSDIKSTNRFLSRFITRYKQMELDVGYYREFNQMSKILVRDSDIVYDDIVYIPNNADIDIDYNFFSILVPLTRILMNQM